ncbi:Abasic site processing protein [Pseudozyma hubeiensis]|nr:Abasic site processing protein [Pseudozyma hubeiensis]
MCGRFANAQTIPQYRAAVREELPDRRPPTPAPDADDYTPSHNVAPQTRSPVVRRELSWERERRLKSVRNPTEQEREHQLIIQTMKWGLIPRFHKKPPTSGEAYRTINARDDTIMSPQRSMWHPLLPSQRCVVFVQGFYEWQKRGGPGEGDKVERIPHFVGMTEPGHGREDKTGHGKRLMPLAGLWERVRFDGEDKPLYTFTIVTTASNEQLGFLHDRMPVILPTPEAISTWLGVGVEPKASGEVKKGEDIDDSWSFEVAKLLRPLQSELECYKVPKEVGKVGNSDPSFILPIEERKDGLKAFFAKQKQPKQASANVSVHPPGTIESSASDVKEEEADNSQDTDSLMPSSAEDSQALRAAQQAEDEAAMAEVAARAEQEEADRKLAEQMQHDFEQDAAAGQNVGGTEMGRSESIVNTGETSESDLTQSTNRTLKQEDKDSIGGDEVGDGFGVPEGEEGPSTRTRRRDRSESSDVEQPSKRARVSSLSSPSASDQDQSSRERSSKFSPDPYNPPLSPPRPRGGYSRRMSPSSGGGIHVNPPRGKNRGKPRHEPFPQAPPHTWKSPPKKERGPMDDMLEKQRRVAERERQDEERLWRELSPSRAEHGKEGDSEKSNGGSPKGKQNRSGGTKSDKGGKGSGADIRSFFSPQKKSPSKP